MHREARPWLLQNLPILEASKFHRTFSVAPLWRPAKTSQVKICHSADTSRAGKLARCRTIQRFLLPPSRRRVRYALHATVCDHEKARRCRFFSSHTETLPGFEPFFNTAICLIGRLHVL